MCVQSHEHFSWNSEGKWCELREGASVVDGAEGNIPDNEREINRQNIDDAIGGTDPKPVDKNLEG